jgi:hypothetical protein
MKNTIITIIVLVVIVVLGYILLTNKPAVNNEQLVANETEVTGTIISVNTDQVPADGPALVNIKQDNGTNTVISVRSMGINLCPAQANIADVYQLKSGDKVEARGQVSEDGAIVPCESAEHYLRIIE